MVNPWEVSRYPEREIARPQLSPTRARADTLIRRYYLYPAGNLGKMLHQLREQTEGGSTIFVAVHSSAFGPTGRNAAMHYVGRYWRANRKTFTPSEHYCP